MWPSWRARQSRGRTSGHLSTASAWWPAPCPEQGVRGCTHRVSVPVGVQGRGCRLWLGVQGGRLTDAAWSHPCPLTPHPPFPLPSHLEADRPADMGDQSSFWTQGQSPGCPHPVLAGRHWHISLLRACSLICPRWLSLFIPDSQLSGVGGKRLIVLGTLDGPMGQRRALEHSKAPNPSPSLAPKIPLCPGI